MTPHRIGVVVPSSNITVETEVPALLARHAGERFSFHSSRMRMQTVSPEQLQAMNAQRERCVDELADARVDALLTLVLAVTGLLGLIQWQSFLPGRRDFLSRPSASGCSRFAAGFS